MCDKCFYAFLCCFLPCIEKREARHERKYDQEEAPRPVESKSKARERGAAAVKTSSPRRRVSAQHCQQVHQDLVANLSQPMNGKQTAAQFRLRMAFSVTKEHLSPDFFTPVIRDLDTVLFSGCLSDRTLVDWKHMPNTSRRTLFGLTLPHGISRISKVEIRLNTVMFDASSKENIWGTVVHEMVHAYLTLTSGWRGILMKHRGSPFEVCCEAAVGRLALEGLEVRHVV